MQYNTRNATRVSVTRKHAQSVQMERRQQHNGVNAGDGFTGVESSAARQQHMSAALTSGTELQRESPTALDRRQRRRRLHPLSA